MLELALDYSSNQRPLFFQIYSYIKQGIMQGQLPNGTFLPSIRSMAQTLKVSKNTVESAYQLLVSEGYISNIPKKGYTIVHVFEKPDNDPNSRHSTPKSSQIKIDFRYGNIELSAFPFHQWNKARNLIIAQYQTYYEVEGIAQGELSLRTELSRLLFETRGVISAPEQMIIGTTPQQLVSLLCELLNKDEYVIGVEDPGYDGARNTFRNHGFHVLGIPLGADGVDSQELENSPVNMLYVSPSQQFSNKMVMSQAKRLELRKWASCHAFIMEDDYEWEYKYEDGYMASIQSLAPDKVIYIGRISKSLLPVTNISYMVLPSDLLSLFHSKITEYDQPVPRLDQLTFAQYLADGYWFKHLQKMRKQYEQKRKAFFEAIAQNQCYFVEAESKDTGLHAFVTIKTNKLESELIEQGLLHGVQVYGTSRYRYQTTGKYPTVLLGYGSLTCNEIQEGIKLLIEAWFGES
ncbi:PLP-dependent aminotransferase family protein [Paenibacillus sp. RC67]|uniref:MocR-like pyridoxine biosynthesis transcription factor PdxR n=1 Tax=Paenibacillus sp. RC67 TaxID=3039392 RepID=UPI0024AE6D97|nr:PLP-dependent aminotransferase family protein [Paenibacillus sp. RC67]